MEKPTDGKNKPRKIAIACQGGGIHGAFACGVLEVILETAEKNLQEGHKEIPAFDLIALSGTSSGALNAFMVWYGCLASKDKPFEGAQRALRGLWDTFQVKKSGEWGMNSFAQLLYQFQSLGFNLKSPAPPLSYDWLMSALNYWSVLENTFLPGLDLAEIRPEFYDFEKLLKTCAPNFAQLQNWKTLKPRLLIGAVEIMGGQFEVFDSHDSRSDPEARQISYKAVAASGTLPEVRRAQKILGLKNSNNQDALYWDGLFSQNPPVRQLMADTAFDHTPDEIWVIRINPQKIAREPIFSAQIDDRINELSGNLSLNQELYFINKVNDWVRKGCFQQGKKEVDLFMITMSPDKAGLEVSSKFNRDPSFVQALREDGKKRAAEFLRLWSTKAAQKWPQDAMP